MSFSSPQKSDKDLLSNTQSHFLFITLSHSVLCWCCLPLHVSKCEFQHLFGCVSQLLCHRGRSSARLKHPPNVFIKQISWKRVSHLIRQCQPPRTLVPRVPMFPSVPLVPM
ncbi:hypothetical protein NQZ68_018290 [Dissostichus eleginoides]|nr:hypothetical protein NQZ68_018290 [Dissostichus eleginoides]